MSRRRYLSESCILSCVLVSALFSASGADARIYRTVDENGNVVFTDVPPKDQAETVELGQSNQYTPEAASGRTRANRDALAAEEEEAPQIISYEWVNIESPGDDEAIRNNAGNLTIVVGSSPTVDRSVGHSIEVLLDGQPQSASEDPLSLENVDRGTHTLVARIIDQDGEILATSNPVTFHMLRYFKRPGGGS